MVCPPLVFIAAKFNPRHFAVWQGSVDLGILVDSSLTRRYAMQEKLANLLAERLAARASHSRVLQRLAFSSLLAVSIVF
jgi:hypothetical protein